MDGILSSALLLGLLLGGGGIYALGMRHGLARHVRDEEERSREQDATFYYQGLNFLLSDEPDKAIESFIQAVRINSETVEIYLSLGNLFRQRGEVGRAIRIHQNIIARPTLSHDVRTAALFALAEDYRQGGFVDRSVDAYRQVLAVEPNHRRALAGLQALHENEGRWDEALNALQRLEQVSGEPDPRREAHLRLHLGRDLARRGERERAEEQYRTAIRVFPGCVEAYRLLGEMQVGEGKLRAAIKSFSGLKKTRPSHFFLLVPPLRQAYEELGDQAGFERCMDGAVAAPSASPRLVLLWGQYLREQGRLDDAVRVCGQGLERYPGSAELARLAGELHLELGQPEKAFACGVTCLSHLTAHQHIFQCAQCGFKSHDIYWKCPQCHRWDTMEPL